MFPILNRGVYFYIESAEYIMYHAGKNRPQRETLTHTSIVCVQPWRMEAYKALKLKVTKRGEVFPLAKKRQPNTSTPEPHKVLCFEIGNKVRGHWGSTVCKKARVSLYSTASMHSLCYKWAICSPRKGKRDSREAINNWLIPSLTR